MSNEYFSPNYSSDEVYRGQDMSICLTDELNNIDTSMDMLKTTKADIAHTHTEYAPLNHTHDGFENVNDEHAEYALVNHTHSEYAVVDHDHDYAEINHTHVEYSANSHSHNYNDLEGLPVIPSTLPANGGNSDTVDGKHASDFAAATEMSALQSLVGDVSVSEQISEALESKANTIHTHVITDISGLSDELDAKYEKPSAGIAKADLSSGVQAALSKAETAVQSLSGYATESYVDTKIAGVIDSSPDALNTLNELAAALGDNPNFATTVATQIGGKVDKVSGKGLSSNDYTNTEKSKLAGISEGANKTVVDSALSSTSTNPVQNKIVNAAISNLTTLVGDTNVSTQISTAIANKVDKVSGKGLSTNDYTTTEKNKLSGIASGAEVNQNAFSSIVVGSTTIAADAKTDSLTLVSGSNITLTPDATNDKITIAAKDTTYSDATTSASGLMSASDKTKLNGIATGANKTTVDSSLSTSSTNPVQNKVVKSAIDNLSKLVGDTAVSTQINNALANIPTAVNPNLLINSDFRNPINQRSSTTYTGNATRVYTIDRWCISATDMGRTIEVCNGYIRYKNPNTQYQGFLIQEFEKTLPEDYYTITVNVKSVTGSNVWVGNLIPDANGGVTWGSPTTFNLQKGVNVFTVHGQFAGLYFQASTSSSIELYWVKLECGQHSTQFTPRIYAEEVALCKRFYQVETLYNSDIACYLHKRNTTSYGGVKHFEPMRIIPTVTKNGDFYIEQFNSSGQVYATMANTFSSFEMVPQWSELRFMIGLSTSDPVNYLAAASESVVLRFDAEIY